MKDADGHSISRIAIGYQHSAAVTAVVLNGSLLFSPLGYGCILNHHPPLPEDPRLRVRLIIEWCSQWAI